ncbi:hypothetical protein ACOME3_000860 [Neoechinorhynchus agilis]
MPHLKNHHKFLLKRKSPITLTDVIELHRRLFGYVSPMDAGTIRDNQIYIGKHVPPPPGELLNHKLDKFDQWLRRCTSSSSDCFLHPVRLAALAHFRLVQIHPFVDGNGRTARLLMNLLLIRAGFPPVIIESCLREVYYRTLAYGHDGDVRPFIRFVEQQTLEAIRNYLAKTGQANNRALEGTEACHATVFKEMDKIVMEGF